MVDPLDAVRELPDAHQPHLTAAARLSALIDVTWRGIYRQVASHAAVRK